jgi:hypothetical protein
VSIQHTVVQATVISNCRVVPRAMPLFTRTRKRIEMPKELAMATISHHAVTRHQYQRSRYNRPVPAPTCRMRLKASLAVSSRKTVADESTNSRTVAARPAVT